MGWLRKPKPRYVSLSGATEADWERAMAGWSGIRQESPPHPCLVVRTRRDAGSEHEWVTYEIHPGHPTSEPLEMDHATLVRLHQEIAAELELDRVDHCGYRKTGATMRRVPPERQEQS